MTLRVVLADDSYLVREAIAHVLADVPEVELAAVCSDVDELRRAIEAERPDVVVTDIRMPPTGDDEGLRVAAELRDSHPEIGVSCSASTWSRGTHSICSPRAPTVAPTCSRSVSTTRPS